tara:strand:+ start:291 stop:533 length:243 start_codon:yes stop_codon:yes gene_type:complete
VKNTVHEIESDDGILIFNGTVHQKAWADEHKLIYWQFDHCSGRHVRETNILNALYFNNKTSNAVAFGLNLVLITTLNSDI